MNSPREPRLAIITERPVLMDSYHSEENTAFVTLEHVKNPK